MVELAVKCYSPLSAVQILSEVDSGDLRVDEVPTDPWPEGEGCHLWLQDRSARGVTLTRSGDSFAVRILPFGTRADWQLGVELSGVLARLSGASIQRGEEDCSLESLSASADEDWARDLAENLTELYEFVADRGTTTITGFIRHTYVGDRILQKVGEGQPGAEALVEVLRTVQYAEDQYHFAEIALTADDDEEEEDEGLRLAAIASEVAYLLPRLNRVLLRHEGTTISVTPVTLYGLLGEGWAERLDEIQAYLAPLTPAQYGELHAACAAHEAQGSEAPESPDAITEGWGPPPARVSRSPLELASQAVRALQSRLVISDSGQTLLELGLGFEHRADLLVQEEPEASLPDYSEAIRQLAKAAGEVPAALVRLGIAYAKRGDASAELERTSDANSDRARAAGVLLRAAPTHESAAHSLLVVTKDRVDSGLMIAAPAPALEAVAPVIELGRGVLGDERFALALTLRGQALSLEDPVAGQADLVAAAPLLEAIEDFTLATPGEFAWLAERLLRDFRLPQDQRRELVEVSSATVLLLAKAGWVPLRQLVQTCTGWLLASSAGGNRHRGLELGAATREILQAGLESTRDRDTAAEIEAGLARVLAEEADALAFLGRDEEARSSADKALALSAAGDSETQAEIEASCAEVYLGLLEPDAALELAVRLGDRDDAGHYVGVLSRLRAGASRLLEDYAGALEALEEAIEFAKDLSPPLLAEGATATTRVQIGQIYLATGRLEEAREVLELALPVLERHMISDGIQFGEAEAVEGYTALGEVRHGLGDSEGAESAWRACERISRRSRELGADLRASDADLATARARCAEGALQDEHYASARALLTAPRDALRLVRVVVGQAAHQPDSPVAAEACEEALGVLLPALASATPYLLRTAYQLCEAAAGQPLAPSGLALLERVRESLSAER
ncbi:MAG: hypothetical protein JKY65_32880 [Planctomycetes bacterium]|nr:hypothetical protein [Planctomycetota bacterium]